MTSPVAVLIGGALAVGGVTGLGVAYVALKHRDHPAARPLAGIAGLPGVVGLGLAALVAVPDSPATNLLLAAEYVLWLLAVGFFLLFAVTYTGRDEWLTRRRRRLLLGYFAVMAAVSGVDMFTKPVVIRTVNGLTFPVLPTRTEGIAYLVAIVSAYVGVFVGTGLLVRFLISSRNMYRKQTGLITGAIGLTVVGAVVYEAGIQFHPGLRLNTLFYSAESVLIALALFRYEFLNVEPLAPEVVLKRIDDPVFVLDDSDVVVDTNPAARMLIDEPDPVGVPVNDLLPGILGAAAKDGEYVPPGATAGSGEGVEVYDLNAAPISDQYDRVRGTVVVLRDVSIRKRREQALERLQSVSQRFLAAETPEEVLEISVTAAEELLGYHYSGAMLYDDEDDVLRPAAFAESLKAAFGDQLARSEVTVGPGDSDVWRVFESGEPMLGDPVEVETGEVSLNLGGSLLYPLGGYGVIGISAGPDHDGFTDEERRLAEILASSTENALDRVGSEQELRESRELLAARTEQIEFFNSVLRHDLLNGMQVIRGHLDGLRGHVDGEASEHVDVIEDWVTDITALTRNVRTVTTVVGDDEAVELRAVDPGAMLSEKVTKMRRGHDHVSIDIATDLDRLSAVRADDFLGEVFENLLGNAIEHNDRDHVEIVVDGTATANAVTVEIADNGPGVEDEYKKEIFEEAFTSDESGSIGFGLYFVRLMIDRYGGDVWFEDRSEWAPSDGHGDDERGAVAVVELPLAAGDGEPDGTGTLVTDD